MANKRVSEMVTGEVGTDSLIPFSVPDITNASGYGSRKDSAASIADKVLNTFEFPLRLLKTTSKTIFGALSEVAFLELTGTLEAGATSIVLSNELITIDSTVDVYTDTFGVSPSSVDVEEGSITLTFSAREEAINVKVRVW